MGFRVGSYAKIWKLEDKGNYTEVQMSTSRKNKETNEYETDFSGFVRFIGHAHNKASQISEGDRIKIGECDVTTFYNKETKVNYTNYLMFDFETQNSENSSTSQTQDDSSEEAEEELIPTDDEMPF